MKLSEIKNISEALKAQWSVNRIRELSPAKLKALHTNATNARDAEVLDMIKQVSAERLQHQKDLKAEADKLKKLKAVKKGDVFEFGSVTLTKADLSKTARKFEEVVGDTFPDGDPIDWMIPYIKREFHCEDWYVGEILDKAVNTLGNYKSYTDYLAQIWDQFVEDDMLPELKNRSNPWK
mgnify:CR=1 FL=1